MHETLTQEQADALRDKWCPRAHLMTALLLVVMYCLARHALIRALLPFPISDSSWQDVVRVLEWCGVLFASLSVGIFWYGRHRMSRAGDTSELSAKDFNPRYYLPHLLPLGIIAVMELLGQWRAPLP